MADLSKVQIGGSSGTRWLRPSRTPRMRWSSRATRCWTSSYGASWSIWWAW